jgi:hypothetical protein
VAAVGLMIIMLVSVTERTGEIADTTGDSAADHPAAIPLRGEAVILCMFGAAGG